MPRTSAASKAPTTPSTARRSRSEDISGNLLDAALSLLAEKGEDAVSVRTVAARAGVAPAGVYSRYDGKAGLLDALLLQGFQRLHATLAPASGPNAHARLVAACDAYRAFALDNPHHYRLMFQHKNTVAMSEAAQHAAWVAFHELVSRVRDAREAGDVHGIDDDTEAAQQIWSALHGAVGLELNRISFTPDSAATFAGLVTTVLAGLRG